MEVRNRFKGLDLIDRVPDELWNEVRHCTGDRGQEHPLGKEMHIVGEIKHEMGSMGSQRVEYD